MTTLFYFFGFIAIVAVYGIITNRLNQRAKCDHIWDDRGDEGIICAKCDKCLKISYEEDEQIMA
jgi:hypothetical protein